MMTDDLNGDVGIVSTDGEGVRTISEVGVEGKTPMLCCFSSFRISRVASIPSITGSWISIWRRGEERKDELVQFAGDEQRR